MGWWVDVEACCRTHTLTHSKARRHTPSGSKGVQMDKTTFKPMHGFSDSLHTQTNSRLSRSLSGLEHLARLQPHPLFSTCAFIHRQNFSLKSTLLHLVIFNASYILAK